MLSKRFFLISGLSFLFVGIVFMIDSLQKITGYIVFEGENIADKSYLISIWFLVAAFVLLSLWKNYEKQINKAVNKF